MGARIPSLAGGKVRPTVPWEITSAILALSLFVGIASLARRLLAKSDEYESDEYEYESDGKPTLLDLWSRHGGGDPGPGG
jgi:hypothetical protein